MHVYFPPPRCLSVASLGTLQACFVSQASDTKDYNACQIDRHSYVYHLGYAKHIVSVHMCNCHTERMVWAGERK